AVRERMGFTINFADKLDPALIRRGRIDKRIETSHCRFEAFNVHARNYWDLRDNRLFADIRSLLEEVDMTPAHVAENLMPKSSFEDNAEACLEGLAEFLEKARRATGLKEAKKGMGKRRPEDLINFSA
ncbi:hypothetical protein ACJRO7_005071, partial [Eucalyptus globulus]